MTVRLVAALALLVGLATPARAGDRDEALYQVGVIFARDKSLWRTDARGKGPPTEVVALPGPASDVRALRTDVAGKVLLADIAGTWHWTRLDGDGTRTLKKLPCTGALTIAQDGACVVCATAKGEVSIVPLGPGAPVGRAVPAAGAIVIGTGNGDRKLVWSDRGVWSAPIADLKKRQRLAPASPIRGLSVSPDGRRAVGVYVGTVRETKTTERSAELLYGFALDGTATRRHTALKDATPVMWSHDGLWVLVQDGSSACVMRAMGGEYKCWKGYTAVSIAPDGSWALVLGKRGDKEKADKDKADKGRRGVDRKRERGARDEGEAGDDEADADTDDASAAPTAGALSLYRARLLGTYTDRPSLVERVVDGPAVWLP